MITLGIIGSDNSHSYSIANICNRLKKVPMRVTHLWGETMQSAEISAEKGRIPHIISDWREMLGAVDGVMIDHRDGSNHYEPARFFIENGVPTIVDKPMTCNLAQARELLSLGSRKKTPVCSFSLVPIQSAFQKFHARLKLAGSVRAVNSSGLADITGPHGGIFFYGFHQVDSIVEILGTEAKSAFLQRSGRNGIATIQFSGGRFASLNCLSEEGKFHWSVCTNQGVYTLPQRYDKTVYLSSARVLHEFISTGRSRWNRTRMLAPIAILEALRKSLNSGRPEKIHSIL